MAATGEAEGDMDAVQRVVHGRQPHRLRAAQNQTLHQALVRMLVTHAKALVSGQRPLLVVAVRGRWPLTSVTSDL